MRVALAWNHLWHRPGDRVRADLLERAVLLLLAFDAWTQLAAHGARYGVGGFNVTHAAWLDALLPLPSPALYVGLVTFAGSLAGAQALGGPFLLGRVAVAASYTLAWAMSLLDAYQHHYLLSLYLLYFTCFGAPWAPRLLAVNTGLVYLFTGLTKLDPEWRSGAALAAVAGAAMEPFLRVAARVELGPEAFWPLAGHAVFLLQFAVGAGYVFATFAGEGTRWAPAIRAVTWALAVAFHLGAEALHLRIGWFSYYMLLVASVWFAPRAWVETLAAYVAEPGAWLSRVAPLRGTASASAIVGWAAVVALSAAGLGAIAHLPGIPAALVAAAVTVAAAGLLPRALGLAPEGTWARLVALLACAVVLFAAMAVSGTRYDYYRFKAGDEKRRGELASALASYERAERYAPRGKSRRAEIEELRRALGEGAHARDSE